MDEKIVVIKLELDTDKYTQQAVSLNKNISLLKANQADLIKQGKQFTAEYEQNAQQLKVFSKELQGVNKTIQDYATVNNSAAGSNTQMRAQLSILTKQLNDMGDAERYNTSGGKELEAQVSSLTETLKKNESAVGDNRRNVGNYSSALKDLKLQLREAKGEAAAAAVAFGADSNEFLQATQKAGKLKDELDDINAATKAMSTGSGIGTFKNQLVDVGRSLADLDFKEAGERAKQLGNIAKTLTFKDLIQGAKGAATAIYETGKAMLSLPIFWVVAGIAAIGAAFYLVSKQTAEAIDNQVKSLDKLGDKYQDLYSARIKFAKAIGKDSDDLELKSLESQKYIVDQKIKILSDGAKKVAGLSKAFGVSGLTDEQEKELAELRKKSGEIEVDITATKLAEIKKRIDADEDAKKKSEENTKKYEEQIKEANKRLKAEQEKAAQDRIDANNKLIKQIADANVDAIADEEQRELAKAALDNARAQGDIATSLGKESLKFDAFVSQQEAYEQRVQAITDKYAQERVKTKMAESDATQKIIDDRVSKVKKVEDDEEKEQEQRIDNILDEYVKSQVEEVEATKKKKEAVRDIEKASLDFISDSVNNVTKLKTQQYDAEIASIERVTKKQIDDAQAQADAGIISQLDFQTKKGRIEIDAQKREAALKLKQWKAEQDAAKINIVIKTAEAVINALASVNPYVAAAYTAIALVTGAEELAVVQNQKPPAFEEGGRILSGQKISSSHGRTKFYKGDSMLAYVNPDEAIVNKRQQFLLGGDRAFQRAGVPGFAGGGLVDGGASARFVSAPIDSQIQSQNQVEFILRNLPQFVVAVQDINDVQSRVARVADRANL